MEHSVHVVTTVSMLALPSKSCSSADCARNSTSIGPAFALLPAIRWSSTEGSTP
jgi:hypothetical protein